VPAKPLTARSEDYVKTLDEAGDGIFGFLGQQFPLTNVKYRIMVTRTIIAETPTIAGVAMRFIGACDLLARIRRILSKTGSSSIDPAGQCCLERRCRTGSYLQFVPFG
jgi:hypothetical protein